MLGVSPKAVQQHGQQRAQELAHRVVKKHAALIRPLRETARAFGYALAVHGSLKRDIDLVAIPWTETAGRAVDVAEALRERAHAVTGFAYLIEGRPAAIKPHGRVGWEIVLGGNVYIDLAVMPRR